MNVSQLAVDLVKQFEGFSPVAYPDPATNGDPWTIGFGSTKGVKRGDTITEAEAEERLREDLQDAFECIADYVEVPINEREMAALASFIYNAGCKAFRNSTLLKILNSGADREVAAAQLLRWNKACGKVMAGLTRRREAERELFLA